jgi:large subunit ribosomal protein L21
MAYAIIEVGGKQYRVEKGDSVVVDRLDAKEGAKLSPRALLYRSDDTVFGGPELGKVKIEAVVVEHLKGPKLRIFKYRPKKRYRKRAGHRSALSRLEIREVKGPAAAKTAAGSAEGRAKAAGDEKKEPAKKPASRRKPAAKKEEE